MSLAGRTAAGRAIIEAELEALGFHWDTAYQVEFDDERGWQARRRDDLGGGLTAATPDELYEAIRADYDAKPVPRDLPGAGDER